MAGARWVRILFAVSAVSVVLAACSSDNGATTGTTGGATAATAPTGATSQTGSTGGATALTIADFAFDPSTITVSGPTDITITNNDSATHSFTLDDGSVDQTIPSGETVTVTVDVSESTGFHCTFHPAMTGTVEVS